MRRICSTAIALLALAVVPAAFAKGPTEARISGPGLRTPIAFTGNSESGPGDFGAFVAAAGFFPSVFGQEPNPMLPGRPAGELGPRYTVEYKVPTGYTTTATVAQDLYPYAADGPVAYTPPGQLVFGVSISGGWFRAYDSVKPLLVDHGLPATAGGGGGGTGVLGPLAAFIAILLTGALFVLALTRVRRRPKPSPA